MGVEFSTVEVGSKKSSVGSKQLAVGIESIEIPIALALVDP